MIRKFRAPITRAGAPDGADFVTIASTPAPDAYGDTINPRGWESAPDVPLLFGHQSRSLPVGRVEKTWIEGDKFMAAASFAAPGLDKFADTVRAFVKAGLLNAVSVGFVPIEQRDRKGSKGEFLGFEFIRQKLLELSIVNVPANDEARIIARAAGLDQDQAARLFGMPASLARARLDVLAARDRARSYKSAKELKS